MTTIGYNSLKSQAAEMGLTLSKSEAGVYWLTRIGDREPQFSDRNFEVVCAWVNGYSFRNQELQAEFAAFKRVGG